MIQLVYEQAKKANTLDEVIVATDDIRIEKAVKSFGGNVLITKSTHISGTERCAEVQQILKNTGNLFGVIINIQGDEPYIDPRQITSVATQLQNKNIDIDRSF